MLRRGRAVLGTHRPVSERGQRPSQEHWALLPCFMGCDAPVATSTVYNQILRHGGFFPAQCKQK